MNARGGEKKKPRMNTDEHRWEDGKEERGPGRGPVPARGLILSQLCPYPCQSVFIRGLYSNHKPLEVELWPREVQKQPDTEARDSQVVQ